MSIENTIIIWTCNCGVKTQPDQVVNNKLVCGHSIRNRTHGHSQPKSKTYSIWAAMKTRCSNKKFVQYANYGGRGIKVCDRWLKFENFLDDMGECPIGFSIERLDNDKNYEPENCKWIPLVDQSKNQRDNVKVTIGDTEMCLAEACRILNKSYFKTLGRMRICNWTVEEALEITPRRRYKDALENKKKLLNLKESI